MLLEPEDCQDVVASSLPPGKDEMNFAESPIALLTDRVPKGHKSIKFEDTVYDERRKKLITRKRVIEGSEEYGLPTATDDTVVLALIQLTKQKSDFTQREVEFTRLELIRMLGWTNEGKNYDRMKLSLQRIANVTYNYDNAWWDGRQRKWTTKIFHILDTVEINDSRATNGQSGLFPSRIVWNEVVFDSFQSGFLRNIDFQLCMRLVHPTALRMYRFLGKRFYIKPDWTFDLKEFAYEHIGLGRNYEGGTQIARKLQPAVDELESVGFLEPLTAAARFPKDGKNWKIRLIARSVIPPAPDALQHPVLPLAEPEPPRLVAELIQRGVTKGTAAELVQRHPAELIERQLEHFDWQMTKKPEKIGEPGGYLRDAIQKDYAAPKGFTSRADRERQAEATRQRQQAEAAARRREKEQQERERAERKAIAAYWDALTKDEQAEHDAAAIAQAIGEELKLIEPGPLQRLGMGLLRDSYTRKLLQAQGQLPPSVEA